MISKKQEEGDILQITALTEGAIMPDGIFLQLEFTDRAPDSFVRVRGMIGTGS